MKIEPEWKKDVAERDKPLKKDRDQQYRELHRDVENARWKRWAEANPEALKEHKKESNAKYRAKRKLELTEEEKAQLREKDRLRKREERARKKALEPPKPPRTRTNNKRDPLAGFAEAVADTDVREGVVILHGQVVDFNSAWASADADLRERIMTRLPSATDQELMDAYCLLHEERYGEPFDF